MPVSIVLIVSFLWLIYISHKNCPNNSDVFYKFESIDKPMLLISIKDKCTLCAVLPNSAALVSAISVETLAQKIKHGNALQPESHGHMTYADHIDCMLKWRRGWQHWLIHSLLSLLVISITSGHYENWLLFAQHTFWPLYSAVGEDWTLCQFLHVGIIPEARKRL